MLAIESLTIRYNGHFVLDSISLQATPGKVTALIGPNGAGKTTLIRAASGNLTPAHGHVLIDGREAHRLRPEERARRVAVVPQAVRLPEAFTAKQTVLMGRTAYLGWFSPETEADRNIAVWAMQRTDTLQFADRRIGQLSGGEQQRVLIARALAQSAPTLLMDEPTAHLDLRHQVEILALAARLAHDSGLAVLIALHDLNLAAQFADWIVLLAEGRMQAAGKPADVLRPECLTEVFGLPIHVIRDPAPGVPLMLVSASAAAIRSADASESGRSSPAASI